MSPDAYVKPYSDQQTCIIPCLIKQKLDVLCFYFICFNYVLDKASQMGDALSLGIRVIVRTTKYISRQNSMSPRGTTVSINLLHQQAPLPSPRSREGLFAVSRSQVSHLHDPCPARLCASYATRVWREHHEPLALPYTLVDVRDPDGQMPTPVVTMTSEVPPGVPAQL